jgi:hypothetical protein
LIARLYELAHDVDPDDRLLLSEIRALRASWLPQVVDDLVEAAWGSQNAFADPVADRFECPGCLKRVAAELVCCGYVLGCIPADSKLHGVG